MYNEYTINLSVVNVKGTEQGPCRQIYQEILNPLSIDEVCIVVHKNKFLHIHACTQIRI